MQATEEFRFKSMRETFEENYKAVKVPANNKHGYKMDYVYIGDWYLWQHEAKEVQKAKRAILNAGLISLILYVAAAIQDDPVNYSRLVGLTGMLSLAPFVFEAFGIVQFYLSKEKLTVQAYWDIAGKLKVAPVLHALLLFCCAAFGIWEVFRSEADSIQLMIPLCYLLSGMESMMVFGWFQRLKSRKVPNAEG